MIKLEDLEKLLRSDQLTVDLFEEELNELEANEASFENVSKLCLLSQWVVIKGQSKYVLRMIEISDKYESTSVNNKTIFHIAVSRIYLYYILGFYPKSIENFLKIENDCLFTTEIKFSLLNMMSIILNDLNMFQKAIEYCDKSFVIGQEIAKKINNPIYEKISNFVYLNNKASLLIKLKNYDSAEEIIKQSKEVCEQLPEPIKESHSGSYIMNELILKYYRGNKKVLDEYLTYFNTFMKNNSRPLVIVSYDVHITFIKELNKLERYSEAYEVANFIYNNHSYSGNKTSLGEVLVEAMRHLDLDEEIKNKHYKDYVDCLVSQNQQHNEIMTLLAEEEYKIADMRTKFNKIENSIITDQLTKCFNRPGLETQGIDFMNSLKKGTLTFIDIDKFKNTNDSYGHLFGDKCLALFAQELLTLAHNNTNIYRYAGDEFIIISEKGKAFIEEKLKEIQNKLDKGIHIDGIQYFIKFSYGIVSFPDEEVKNYAQLIKAADKKMYENKNNKFEGER